MAYRNPLPHRIHPSHASVCVRISSALRQVPEARCLSAWIKGHLIASEPIYLLLIFLSATNPPLNFYQPHLKFYNTRSSLAICEDDVSNT